MRSISTALLHLRYHLPSKFAPKDKRLSKIQTLRYAIRYISELLQTLETGPAKDGGLRRPEVMLPSPVEPGDSVERQLAYKEHCCTDSQSDTDESLEV